MSTLQQNTELVAGQYAIPLNVRQIPLGCCAEYSPDLTATSGSPLTTPDELCSLTFCTMLRNGEVVPRWSGGI